MDPQARSRPDRAPARPDRLRQGSALRQDASAEAVVTTADYHRYPHHSDDVDDSDDSDDDLDEFNDFDDVDDCHDFDEFNDFNDLDDPSSSASSPAAPAAPTARRPSGRRGRGHRASCRLWADVSAGEDCGARTDSQPRLRPRARR
jgi:hypothetical protein